MKQAVHSEVFLADEAMRSFSYRELQPHNERDTQNRLYKKFQLAQEPMLMDTIAKFECTDPSHLRFDKDTPEEGNMDRYDIETY
ncbi:hypothetical protein NXX40_14665 [Parabacteroides distasonis]|nr:hypothetical protein [Parabacteroides distasonis]